MSDIDLPRSKRTDQPKDREQVVGTPGSEGGPRPFSQPSAGASVSAEKSQTVKISKKTEKAGDRVVTSEKGAQERIHFRLRSDVLNL